MVDVNAVTIATGVHNGIQYIIEAITNLASFQCTYGKCTNWTPASGELDYMDGYYIVLKTNVMEADQDFFLIELDDTNAFKRVYDIDDRVITCGETYNLAKSIVLNHQTDINKTV